MLPVALSDSSSSPLSYLPPEILEQILLEVGAHYSLSVPPRSYGFNRSHCFTCPALVVSWVCARWRAITLANPAFWTPSIITVDLAHYDGMAEDHEEHAFEIARGIALLDCYLGRSRSRPLPSVRIHGYLDDYEDWEDTVGAIVRCIARSAHRWQDCSMPEYVAHWLSTTPDAAPDPVLLEQATVDRLYGDSVYYRLDFFCRAPRLREWLGNIRGRAAVLPWRQLTEIRVWQFMPVQRFMRFIQHCEQLVDLEINLHRPAGAAPLPPFGTMLLPKLDSATFTLDNEQILSSVLATLVTPKLKTLVLVGSSPLIDWDDERKGHLCLQSWPTLAFGGWLTRSQCPLQGLVLAQITMPRDDLVWALEQLPSLQEFSLQELMMQRTRDDQGHRHPSSVDDGVLRRLSAPPGGRPELLPELRGLTIGGGLHFDFGWFVDMVKSRVDPPLGLLALLPEEGSTTVLDEGTQAQLKAILGDNFLLLKKASLLHRQRLGLVYKHIPRSTICA
ncbi:hypothetical protein EV121DRAFT_202445 [Schizophyllum commune]